MSDHTFESRLNLNELQNSITRVREEIGKVIVGQTQMVDLLMTALLADGHVLLEGVPGVAKTLTAKLLARTIAVDFARIQFTPDLMPSDVLGTSVFNLKTSSFDFKAGPIFSNIVLIDEINRAPAKTQSALFEVMEERQVTVDGLTHLMKSPYLVVATQNPIEHEGTYRLPEAQLDRFLFKITIDYPDLDQEVMILTRHHGRRAMAAIEEVKPVLTADQLAGFRAVSQSVHVEENLLKYIARIAQETRKNAMLFLGASPRASVAMLNAAKAYASLAGRDFVTPEDIKTIALPALRHRISLNPDKEMEGVSPDDVVRQVIDRIEVPR
ncbi:MAG: MoxR family ATPase [Bacteroidetes bacterium]|nr:MoxR family ATPase [Bacteroidota bacterium]